MTIRAALRDNKPVDEFVRDIVTAEGSTYTEGPVNFYRTANNAADWAESTSQLFLGVRMVCAHCHGHPFEKWTQNQYFQLSAFFAGVAIKDGMDSNEEIVYEKREGA